MSYRLGVDVGGTFTDLLLVHEKTGKTWSAKVPSTPADQSIGVLNGILRVCERAGIDPQIIDHVMHGTTVATNTVLTGTGARVGLVTTKGYRQVLQIARSYVPGGLGGWIIYNKSLPMAPLACTIEADERVSAKGEVVRGLDEEALRKSLRTLKVQKIEALTVSLINSFANPAHEQRVREIAIEELPDTPVSLSSDVVPEMQEYERTVTTVANSYVRPRVDRYVRNLKDKLAKVAKNAKLHILRSDGGGTSTDVALISGGQPRLRRETTVGDVTVRASSVDIRTVGAGGGSIAHVPELTKALRVGPQSAGADPGPAAYNRGGTEPTVADANIVLGYLPEMQKLGGDMVLDRSLATAAVKKIGDALGLNTRQAAQGIYNIVNENMVGALRLVSVEQGYDPREYALIAFGGAGPLHANALSRLLGSWPSIIPPGPGVLCALGDATTAVRDERARTYVRKFSETTAKEIEKILKGLATDASKGIEAEGVKKSEISTTYQVDVRYHGQGLRLSVEVNLADLQKKGLKAISDKFDAEHKRLFTFTLPREHELVTLRAAVQGQGIKIKRTLLAKGGTDPKAAIVGKQKAFMDGKDVNAIVYDRTKFKAGNKVRGPAIVVEMDSTSVILPKHTGHVDKSGCILIYPDNFKAPKKAAGKRK
jgi:N-methylhydantoinase A